jgi:hypothetical protein
MKMAEKKSERGTTLFSSKLAALATAVIVTAALAVVGGAFSGKALAQTPSSSKPFAVGAFTTATEHVAFAAQTTGSGKFAGYVVQELTGVGTDSGPVTCLSVSGNTATVSFSVKNGPNAPGHRTFTVMDGGEPMMGVSPDMYSDCGASNGMCDTPNNCMMEALVSGNIVVSSGQ